MKRIYLLTAFLLLFLCQNYAFSIPYFGQVQQNVKTEPNRLIDSKTQKPISDAKVSLPQKKYTTKTDKEGKFFLDAQLNGATILNIEKQGYKPYSLTIDEYALSKPLIIGIEKSSATELMLEKDLFHIGDNNFSQTSANASEFRAKSMGAYYSKNFKISSLSKNSEPYLIIGSIIGIDTLMAKQLGQSHAKNTYASAPEIYFNGNKIADIQINGDNQQVKIPRGLVKYDATNTIVIKAGKNLFQHAYTDYDDIELMNVFIDYKDTTLANY